MESKQFRLRTEALQLAEIIIQDGLNILTAPNLGTDEKVSLHTAYITEAANRMEDYLNMQPRLHGTPEAAYYQSVISAYRSETPITKRDSPFF